MGAQLPGQWTLWLERVCLSLSRVSFRVSLSGATPGTIRETGLGTSDVDRKDGPPPPSLEV